MREQPCGEHGERHERACAGVRRSETVLGVPRAPAARAPVNDGGVGEAPGERGTDCVWCEYVRQSAGTVARVGWRNADHRRRTHVAEPGGEEARADEGGARDVVADPLSGVAVLE